jgi:4-hydroxybenzoate polyprenyltransferase
MTEPKQTPEPWYMFNKGRVHDATRLNWVDRFCPTWSHPYLRLSRADRPIGTWLLLIPCWWGILLAKLASGHPPGLPALWVAVACGFGAFLMRGAGCTWNDISDMKIDAQVERTRSRPLPSGQISKSGAFTWMGLQALIAFAFLLTFNQSAVILGIVALAPVLVYPFAKRFTWWPQVFLGLAFNWGALLGWTAIAGSLQWPAVVLYFAGISWTLFYDTIYAHQDKEDDALIGVKSTARLFAENSKIWLRGFMATTVLLFALAVILAAAESANVLALTVALAGVWAMGWHLAWQLRQLDIDNPENCLKLFRSNRDAGLLVGIFVLIAAFV